MSSDASEPVGAPARPDRTQSIAAFYDADPRRRDSEEVEYGDAWTRHEDGSATYRINHVLETGELYAVREPHPGGILARYLDQLNVDQADIDQLTVEVLAILAPDDAARLLEGWQEAMVGTDSLRWVEQRLVGRGPVSASPPVPPTG